MLRNKYVKANVSSDQNMARVIIEELYEKEIIIYIVAYVSFTHQPYEVHRQK